MTAAGDALIRPGARAAARNAANDRGGEGVTAAGDALIQSGARVRKMVKHVQTWRFDVIFGRVSKIPKPCGCRKCRQRQLDRALARVLDDSEAGSWADALKFPPWSEHLASGPA